MGGANILMGIFCFGFNQGLAGGARFCSILFYKIYHIENCRKKAFTNCQIPHSKPCQSHCNMEEMGKWASELRNFSKYQVFDENYNEQVCKQNPNNYL